MASRGPESNMSKTADHITTLTRKVAEQLHQEEDRRAAANIILQLNDPNAATASDDLLPEAPFIAFTDARFQPGGQVIVTMTVPDRDGYSVRDLMAAYRLDGDRLSVEVDDLHVRFTTVLDDHTLLLSNDEGTMRLRRRDG